ncbi:MAG: hypothetical protein LBM66_05655, partial [Bifidobacteriaceae bacterium]|nr:hypothetical protein [Bifidobacteriaceae bacterium]
MSTSTPESSSVPVDPELQARSRPLDFPATRRPGVYLSGDGVDVAVTSYHATGVWLCLVDREDTPAQGAAVSDAAAGPAVHERRVALYGPTFGVWHAHVPGVTAGQRYGFRAAGPWDPAAGSRFNPAKLLLDPYGRAIDQV